MEYNFQNETLTIFLPERIDSANASEIEREMTELTEDYEPRTVIMDAVNMKYICSAGLRIVLNIKKKAAAAEVINASSEVYEIFKTTGFNIVLKITKARRKRTADLGT